MTVEALGRFRDPPLSMEANLARDEALLRAGCPAVRVSHLNDQTVSIGVGVRVPNRVTTRAAQAAVPVLRRTSGGSAVVHFPEDIVWSVVWPRQAWPRGSSLESAYTTWGEAVVRTLGRWKIPAVWSPAVGVDEEYCLLSGRGKVLEARHRVLGGAAQHLTREALLHHGIVSTEPDAELLEVVGGLSPTVIRTRLASLSELGITRSADRSQFEEKLLDDLVEVYSKVNARYG